MARYSVEFDDFEECQLHANAPALLSILTKVYETARQQLKHGDESRDRVALEAVMDLASQCMEFQ